MGSYRRSISYKLKDKSAADVRLGKSMTVLKENKNFNLFMLKCDCCLHLNNAYFYF